MAGIPLDVISDICNQVGQWQHAFLSETSLKRYRRACAWTMSEVAKAAAGGATAAVDEAFQDPTPWMRRAFKYMRALNKGSDEVDADVFVLPSQSIVMKYSMGDGPNVRRPGDVGLAKDTILVPNWKNLQLTQGINRNSYGNLPGGVAARLAREALGQLAKHRAPGRWGVYKGELDVGGSRVMGYIARPPRGYAPIGKNGREIVVNLGRPRALLVAIQQATYKPVMQPFYDKAMRKAVERIPAQMGGELRDAIEYRAANGGMRRLGAA
ncbi:hypothetical protein GOFOIKOB_4505 [Methylobacterium tardum]|uniref:Uncharacterized protein n=1 Tax=Methylobacterium tardum TaxID=374432 RepID=A0AA37TLQ1_9HYPH|nr:hypothetical protein [Methylobacterium tardum]URD39468.1 hypothetical protein M6G65_14285 [Methylobacterium tardum]GJE51446.1 hypothetical protein GOFOIKOB_4505 [Methylobacterium tardum]GLS73658.1 hypothetical protein GCM10007890_56730 [Methylobacterium tardum]